MVHSTLITGPERRRRWSEEQKLAVLSAAFAPGASVADVARQADVCTSVIYRWRKVYRIADAPVGFAPAVLVDAAPGLPAGVTRSEPVILAEFIGGTRVSIASTAPAALVTATLRALR